MYTLDGCHDVISSFVKHFPSLNWPHTNRANVVARYGSVKSEDIAVTFLKFNIRRTFN